MGGGGAWMSRVVEGTGTAEGVGFIEDAYASDDTGAAEGANISNSGPFPIGRVPVGDLNQYKNTRIQDVTHMFTFSEQITY